MARKRKIPKYKVKISLNAWDIAKAGAAVQLRVRYRDGRLVGTAEIGQGTFGWKKSNAKKFKRIQWGQMADAFQ